MNESQHRGREAATGVRGVRTRRVVIDAVHSLS